MNTELIALFRLVTAPLVLISGIGIYTLTINARYTHVIGLVRELHTEGRGKPRLSPRFHQEMRLILQRAVILKWSIGLLVSSTVSSGLMVFLVILGALSGWNVYYPGVILLFISCLLIVASMAVFFVDVIKSLNATLVRIEKEPNRGKIHP